MRLVTWNCHHGTAEDRLVQLQPLHPDLVILQECRRPALPFGDVIWSGTRDVQGLAVTAVSPALRLERLDAPLPPTAIAVLVHAPTPFLLLALWTHPAPTYEAFALNALRACAATVGGELPMLVAGDLNITATADAVRVFREEFGLVSAYHHHHRVEPWAEAHATHFWRFKETSPWHIDFCFVPEGWATRIRDVQVGAFRDWNDSDHRPVIIDLDL